MTQEKKTARLIRGEEIIVDTWLRLDDEATLPATGDVIVSLNRLLAERAELRRTGEARLGLELPVEVSARTLDGQLEGVSLITLSFPHFRDGRAYSQASILRQMGYKGTLRATGDVLQDQLFFMRRCGIEELALREDKSAEKALESLAPFSHAYQDAADGRALVAHTRA